MIDKESYDVLKFIYKRKSASKQNIEYRFKKMTSAEIDYILYHLRAPNHLIENPYTGEQEPGNCPIRDWNTFEITLAGKAYVEERRQGNRRWRIPVIISVIALVVSISAIVVSILP